jgi:3-deoxy-D-manno-octulosonate 8-phosphate phosphatase (KDO 8-P phosphatase)
VDTGIEEKMQSFETILTHAKVSEGDVAYVGDDLPDLPIMRRCGIPLAVANAFPEVKRVAAYVSRRPGGGGAAAELIEWLLRLDGTWQRARALS